MVTPPRGRGSSHVPIEGVPIPTGLQILESQGGSQVLTPFTTHRKGVSIPREVPEKGARREEFGVPWYLLGCHVAIFWRFPRGVWHPFERCRVA